MSLDDSTGVYEIVELENGDVALRRADEEAEPLVSIRFCSKSLSLVDEAKFEVAKAMLEAGLDAVADLESSEMDDLDVAVDRVVH